MKSLHFIPVVNRTADLLPQAVRSVKAIWDRTYIIDNRDTEEERAIEINTFNNKVRVIRPPVPLTTAQTMNYCAFYGETVGADFFTWMHTDGEALGSTATELIAIASNLTRNKERWGVVFTNYDVMAAYNLAAVKEVGGWDWLRFPFYFHDTDFHRRLKNGGWELVQSNLPVEHHCGASATIKSDPTRGLVNSLTFPVCQQLYDLKWSDRP